MNRGSEWRIWDLHVHTPASITHNYKARLNLDIWESYIEDLEHLPSDIKVLGINDYLFIDGYKKVLEFKRQGRLKNIDLILPVIEFRLAKFAGNAKFKRINFHVIFSNEISPDIIEHQFLNALTRNYKLSSDYQGLEWGGVITRENLENLGQQIINQVPIEKRCEYDAPIKEGFNNLNLEYDCILDALEGAPQYFKGKYLTAIGKSEWDDLKWDTNTIADKKDIINRCSLVFSASESVEAYNKSKQSLVAAKVNSLLLDCSDAHANFDSANKDRLGNCHTWIKADPTFRGLQQILFEPNERVCVSEIHPELKQSYSIIDHVELHDNEGKIWNQNIYFNQNLNAIIGGRSTGKSNLLSCIAAHLSHDSQVPHEKYIDEITDSVKVFWSDGAINAERKIEYFPQNYIYSLADKRDELDKLLLKTILSPKELTQIYAQYRIKCNDCALNVSTLLNQFLERRRLYIEENNLLQSMGDSKGIKFEINKLRQEKKQLEEKGKFDSNALQNFAQTTIQLTQLSHTISLLNSEKVQLLSLRGMKYVEVNPNLSFLGLSDSNETALKVKIQNVISDANHSICQTLDSMITDSSNMIELKQKEYNGIKNSPNYLAGKKIYENNKVLADISNRLQEQEKQLAAINDEAEKQTQLYNECESIFCQLVDAHLEYLLMVKSVVKSLHLECDDIKLASHVMISTDLQSMLEKSINLQSGAMTGLINGLVEAYSTLDETKLKDNLIQFMLGALKGQLKFKKNYEVSSFLNTLLSSNWFQITFDAEYDNDSLTNMSPGKRAFVILKLMLEFSTNNTPVLIDQPEDNLDNRAIYQDLVAYIRKKKKTRQIILITHNPNIVVGADAENVIVANQHGVKTPNVAGIKFQYKNGSLEESFRNSDENESILETMGIREHVCEILEGGEEAFRKRESKYGFFKI